MRRIGISLVVLALLALAVAAVASAGGGRDERPGQDDHGDRGASDDHGKRGRYAVATLMDAAGQRVGRVWLQERHGSGGVDVSARVWHLSPGFHGFHIHATGRCDPPGFTSAGGHLNPTGASHGAHAGDLPSLLVNADGTGKLATATDRFTIADLRDADGSAVMVHSGPDNFANIPPRYGTPDQETLNTGDSGRRPGA